MVQIPGLCLLPLLPYPWETCSGLDISHPKELWEGSKLSSQTAKLTVSSRGSGYIKEKEILKEKQLWHTCDMGLLHTRLWLNWPERQESILADAPNYSENFNIRGHRVVLYLIFPVSHLFILVWFISILTLFLSFSSN